MEIIKRGDWQPPTFTAELVCYNCHSVLKIDANDVQYSYASYGYRVECPVCGRSLAFDKKTKKLYYKYLDSR